MFRFAANLSLMFCEWPLVDRFQAARDAGFAAVELHFPYAQDASQLARAVERAGVEVVLINTPVSAQRHPYGIACRPELRDDFRSNLTMVREFVEALGVRHVNVLAGTCPNPAQSETCRSMLVENLLLTRERLAPLGVDVLLEPLNEHDAPDYLVDDFDEARSLLERCGSRVGLQFDIYHAAMMGGDPGELLASLLPLVRHVQFADVPGRHEPGTGRLRFHEALGALDASGYRGAVAAEYRPSATTLESLGWLDEWREHYGTRTASPAPPPRGESG